MNEASRGIDVSPMPGRGNHFAIGLFWGLAGAFAWAGYNAGTKLGFTQGFQVLDLAMLRFGVAALLFLPILLRSRPPTTPRRLAVLVLLCGPIFGILINLGFSRAPIAHAVVLGPGMTMISANAWTWALDGVAPSRRRLMAMALLLVGLAIIGSSRLIAGAANLDNILGDMCFVATGTLWGTAVYLLGRWHVPPVTGTAWIVTISALCLLPVYMLGPSTTLVPSSLWLHQAVFQGVLGGCLGSVAVAMTVSRLGSPVASLFPAIVPAAAILLSVPMLGEWPSSAEMVGVAIGTLGLLMCFERACVAPDICSRA